MAHDPLAHDPLTHDLPAHDPLTRAGDENFPVALRLLPADKRRQLRALYGFARFVDDVGDEAGPAADVNADLDAVRADLDRVFAGRPARLPALAELPATVAACSLPRAPFEALIEANRLDQVRTDYATRAELLEYCTLSANPVGHLVLGVFGVPVTPGRRERSDQVCTALQLVEHLQDVGQDARRGRIYLPRQDRERQGVSPEELLRSGASANLRRLVAEQARWAASLLESGSALVGELHGWARVSVAGYVAGGAAALAGLRRRRWDPLPGPPAKVRRSDLVRIGVPTLGRGRLG